MGGSAVFLWRKGREEEEHLLQIAQSRGGRGTGRTASAVPSLSHELIPGRQGSWSYCFETFQVSIPAHHLILRQCI